MCLLPKYVGCGHMHAGPPSTVGIADVLVGAVVTWCMSDLPAFLPACIAVRTRRPLRPSMALTVSRSDYNGFLNPRWYLFASMALPVMVPDHLTSELVFASG